MAENTKQVAFHEAGHALAAYVLLGGSSIVYVKLLPEGSLAGVCRIKSYGDPFSKIGECYQALAGPAAERVYARKDNRRPPGADREDMKLARLAAGGTLRKTLLPALEVWLATEEIWTSVELIANRLLVEKELSAEQIDELLPYHEPLQLYREDMAAYLKTIGITNGP